MKIWEIGEFGLSPTVAADKVEQLQKELSYYKHMQELCGGFEVEINTIEEVL